MQKRVVYNFNAQPATETATGHANGKAVKASNAIGKIKRAFFGKGLKLAVFVVLLFASLFCAIGSADWIISQQKDVPSEKDGTKTFNVDDFGLDKYIIVPPNSTYNGNPVCAEMKTKADGGARELPDKAIDKANVKYKVIPYNKPSAQSRLLRAPQNAASTERNKAPAANAVTSLPNEDDFKDIDYVTELPTNAGTYAVLITSEVKGVSYGKAIKVFTISQKELTVKAKDKTLTYGDPVPTFNETDLTYEGLLDCDIGKLGTPKFTCTYTTKSPVGKYDITVSGLNNLNYDISYQSGTLTVTQRTVTIAWETKNSFVYDGNAHTRNHTAENVVTGDDLDLTVTVSGENITDSSAINAGTYTATAKITNANYVLAEGSKTATFTITQRTVTLDWGANSFAYDGNAHTLTPTAQNAVSNDNLGLTVTVTGEKITDSSAINAGTYTATAKITNTNYILDESSKTATFTITPRPLTVTATSHQIIYGDAPSTKGYTISGFIEGETFESANISGTVKITTNYTKFKDVGKYDIFVDISELSSHNYSFNAVNGILTVNKKELTVKAKDHEITYGDEPSANGYEISGFVNNENESVITGLDSITYTFDYSQYDNIYNGTSLNDYYIEPVIGGLSAKNYAISAERGKLTVNQLPLTFADNAVISRKYTKNGIPFSADLFNAAEDNKNTTCYFKSTGATLTNDILNNIYKDVSTATSAKNFSGEKDTTKPENGFYNYTFGENIIAGSTYLISDITLKPNSNFELITNSIYLKYNTARIEKPAENKTEFFTIEDALAAGGDITLCGNIDTSSDSPNSSYVITAFAKLKNLPGTGFENYKVNYEYTLKSNNTLLLPYNSDDLATNADSDVINCEKEPEYVYSVLAISQGIKFTISGTLDIGGRLSSRGGDFNQARVKQHSVVYNNGTIVVTNRINSYGYLKGANDGLVELQSTATALDIMQVYDWLAGTEAIQIHNAGIFPFKSYSIHNISCKTKIMKGAQYLAKASLNVQNTLLPSNPIPIVGASDSMFTVESGYILKTASNADSNRASTDLTSITGTNQLKGQKDIITLGENTVCHDNSITLTIEMAGFTKEITTSKDYPLPISYFNLVVPNTAILNLNAVSYIFYPGSSLKVEAGGKLEVENVSVAFYTLNDCISDENWGKNRVKYATAEGTNDYAVDRTDAKLAIDAGGTATIKSNASISGCITATNAQAQLIINSSTSVTVKVPTDLIANNVASKVDKGLIATGIIKASITKKTYTAFGDIMTGQNSYARQDFSTGTYYSTKIGSAYAWFKNSATITCILNGGTLNGTSDKTEVNVTLPSGGYTSTRLPEPTRKYYSFGGWYFDPNSTQEATTIYTTCTLYAKWTPIQYTIKYNLPYDECGALANGSLSGSEVKTLANPPQTITVNGNEYIFGGWYLNSEYMNDRITAVSAANADNSKIINVYALYYRVGTYTVNYEENPEGLGFTSEIKKEDKPSSQVFDKGVSVSQSELRSLKKYNENTSFNYYFDGWYLKTDSNKTIIKFLPKTIDGDITLCAKWIKKRTIIVQKSPNETVNGITGGLGTFYASPLDTTYATAVTCTLIANKERYTPKYSATNASVDANGVISFANSNSAENVIINITTQRWFMVYNQYTDKITLKLDSSTGTQDGNWFTENSKVTVTISGRSVPWGYEKATIQKNGIEIAVLEQKYMKSADYTINSLDGYYTISKK